MWSCILTWSGTLPYTIFFSRIRLWKIRCGNSCRKQTRQLKRTRIRLRCTTPWPAPWGRPGQPWSPCSKDEGSSSNWPLNFLKVPWRFVFKKKKQKTTINPTSAFSMSEQINSTPEMFYFYKQTLQLVQKKSHNQDYTYITFNLWLVKDEILIFSIMPSTKN